MIDIKQETFCAAPWFQCRNTNQSQFRACCAIKQELSEFQGQVNFKFPESTLDSWLNSDYMHYLRENLSNGVKLKECNDCWNRESKQIASERQIINQKITELNGFKPGVIKSYFKQKNNYQFDLLLIADLKISNTCNFSCIMCNPEDSSQLYSLWAKNNDQWFVKAKLQENPKYFEIIKESFIDKNNLNLLSSLLELKPKIIKLLGGEPLLEQSVFDLLSSLPIKQQQQTSIQIITNGSQDLCLTKEKLINFKNLVYTVSLEGTEHIQDFVRKGSVWAQIDSNIDNYIKKYGTENLSIHTTIQALTLFHFDKLLSWAKNKNISLDFLILKEPEYLSLEAIPKSLIEQSINKLAPHHGHAIENLIANLKKINHDPLRTEKFKQFVNWHNDSHSWLALFPEWASH